MPSPGSSSTQQEPGGAYAVAGQLEHAERDVVQALHQKAQLEAVLCAAEGQKSQPWQCSRPQVWWLQKLEHTVLPARSAQEAQPSQAASPQVWELHQLAQVASGS